MAKRKRTQNLTAAAAPPKDTPTPTKKTKTVAPAPSKPSKPASKATSKPSKIGNLTIQIITGSYDRILHGITATLPPTHASTTFSDTFLFTAATSSLRALALSAPSTLTPGQPQKLLLATGSTDSRINLYHISAHPPRKTSIPAIPSLRTRAVVENPANRELGSLTHHAAAVTALAFPTRGKLLSASEDSTIAVTRTRDWSLLSAIKAPIPKAVGRPSGDTAPAGGAPSGVNAFAVHPSLKLMVSVGRGEKCMRLWNLVTGKKAGVLSFSRELLGEVLEGRFASGEGRKVAWGNTRDGEEFAVAFEWGVAVFGMDCKARCKVLPDRKTKIHEIKYIKKAEDSEDTVLAISTEDGRVLFFSTEKEDLVAPKAVEGKEAGMSSAKLLAQVGGKDAGVTNRVKDFAVLPLESGEFIVVTGSSDGAVRLWTLSMKDVLAEGEKKQVGQLAGCYETGNRITCLVAFEMLPLPEGASDEVMESDEEEEEGEGESSEEE
jgi:protein MAK11